MINSKEYVIALKVTREIMPMLSRELGGDEDLLFNQMNEIRLIYKKMYNEFQVYRTYPRQNMSFFKKYADELKEYLADSIIVSKMTFNLLDCNEDNWKIYKNIDELARFYYQGIEITKLIKL